MLLVKWRKMKSHKTYADYGNKFWFSTHKYFKRGNVKRCLTPKVKVGGWHVDGFRPLIVLCVMAVKRNVEDVHDPVL